MAKSSGGGRFNAWLSTASPGDSYVYHSGGNCLFSGEAEAARRAYDRGEVELVQNRLSFGYGPNPVGTFEYIAQKRKNIARRNSWFVNGLTGQLI